MASYTVNNRMGGTQQNIGTTAKTVLTVTSQTTGIRRGKIYEVNCGADGVPADNPLIYDIIRCTSIGSGGTNIVPPALDGADGLAVMVATGNQTGEPGVTATAVMLTIPLNQRATYRWVAAPGMEFVVPATNANGFAFRASSTIYASTVVFDVMWQE
jgi:hypothetical protein